MRSTVLLFDIDGTLIDCGGAGRRAIEAGFRSLGGAAEAFSFSFGGRTDRSIAREALRRSGRSDDEHAIDQLLRAYLACLPEELARSEGYRVHEGVVALLDALAVRDGIALGLGTGNVVEGARHKLTPAGLFARFSFGGFGSDHEDRAQLLECGARRGAALLGVARSQARVVVVGDTRRDIAAAHAINAECVAVATGAARREELEEEKPALVVQTLAASDVLPLLLR